MRSEPEGMPKTQQFALECVKRLRCTMWKTFRHFREQTRSGKRHEGWWRRILAPPKGNLL